MAYFVLFLIVFVSTNASSPKENAEELIRKYSRVLRGEADGKLLEEIQTDPVTIKICDREVTLTRDEMISLIKDGKNGTYSDEKLNKIENVRQENNLMWFDYHTPIRTYSMETVLEKDGKWKIRSQTVTGLTCPSNT